MRLLGGLLGGKGGVREDVKELLNEAAGPGVSTEVLDRCLGAQKLEEIIEDEVPRRRLTALAKTSPENVAVLVGRCVGAVEGVLDLEVSKLDEKAETRLANALIVLTHIFAAGPEEGPAAAAAPHDSAAASAAARSPREASTPNSIASSHELLRLLWDPERAEEGRSPVAERLADAALRVLFLGNFTIDGPDDKAPPTVSGSGDGGAGTDVSAATEFPAASSRSNCADCGAEGAVNAELLWYADLGPPIEEAKKQRQPDEDLRENRHLALQLLLAMLCSGAPASVAKATVDDKDAKPRHSRGKNRAQPEKAVAAWDGAKPLVVDHQLRLYLCDPGRPVPLRGELLLSLLSVALGYDPHGYGMPYGGLFAGKKVEDFVTTAIQVLGMLLQDCSSAVVASPTQAASAASGLPRGMGSPAVALRRPQERFFDVNFRPLPSPGHHAFRAILDRIASEREVEFVFNGLVTLFGTMSDVSRSYLPGSMRVPPFLTELLVILFHLSACDSFVKGFCERCDVPALTECLARVIFQEQNEYLREDALVVVATATTLRLTAYREFCDKLNEAYQGEVPGDVPDFEGSCADLLAMLALWKAGDKLATAQANAVHGLLVEMQMCILANISTFAEGFCKPTCFRLFALFERCARPAQLRKGRNGVAIWLPYLLESIENALQYQYSANLDLVYGLMTRRAFFLELRDLVGELKDSKGEQQDSVNNAEGGGNPTDSSGTTPAAGDDALPAEWWAAVEARLQTVTTLLDAITPRLEAEVERKEIWNPDQAKKLLPRSALGLLPVPHAFAMRSLLDCECTERACEHCLYTCVFDGPSGTLWEDPGEENGGAAAREGRRGRSGSRDRKSDKARGHADSGRAGARARSRSKGPRQRPPDLPSKAPAKPASAASDASAEGPDLVAQLQAAAAAGVDIKALLAQLQETKSPAAASAGKVSAEPVAAAAAQQPAAAAEEDGEASTDL